MRMMVGAPHHVSIRCPQWQIVQVYSQILSVHCQLSFVHSALLSLPIETDCLILCLFKTCGRCLCVLSVRARRRPHTITPVLSLHLPLLPLRAHICTCDHLLLIAWHNYATL
jgi:hypothetical protein